MNPLLPAARPRKEAGTILTMTTPSEETASEPQPDASQTRSPPVFLAFQGGGARGIAHVGGLAAVNELGLTIAGVAGTSAGAIMAALVAAHYRADQLLDPENRTHLLQVVAGGRFGKATDLFGRDWRSIRWFRRATAAFGAVGRCWRNKWPGRVWGLIWARKWGKLLVGVVGLLLAVELDAHLSRLTLASLLFVAAVAIWVVGRCLAGLASLNAVRELVDEAIAEGLKIDGRGITFEQLKACGGLPLKLVATNVSGQALELFSLETTPTVKVADAVAASICLPIVFRPWTFPYARRGETAALERRFIDGGLLSNLPVWTFDEERALQPDAVTIAFGLKPPPSNGDRPHWLSAALQTVVAGPPEIHFRGIDRMIHIPLDCGIKVLDFDSSFDQLGQEVASATSFARDQLQRNLTEVPAAIRETLADMRREVGDALREAYPEDFAIRDSQAPLFRIALAIQRPGDRMSLAIAYEVGHSRSRQGQRFSLETSPVGRSWREGQRGFYVFNDSPGVGEAPDPARIYEDSAWTGLVPIFEPGGDKPADAPGTRGLAVVAILDSPLPLPDSIGNSKDRIGSFGADLLDAASDFFDDVEMSRLSRGSNAWL
ncbi:patatin-like phospholipase family protein [Paraburkholderia sp. EG304]|uniref:patatin-like phospholipase family protein n=1 Tax=Paraburkholderia sp. EG304 TaxID=3237015 RepID=UPI00397B4029